MRKSSTFLLLFFLLASAPLFGQGTQVEFGKNRVQHHDEFAEWLLYESPNFITYWYGEGRNIGQSVVQIAEMDFANIMGVLEHRMNDRIEILVYKDLTDLKQSNIGVEEAFVNTGGQTKIVGNKIFVYFNGDHTHLRRQIREGIASVYLNAMLFGSNLQEIVQNAVMMNLPEWFKQGLIAYVGEEWNAELDNQLKDLLLQKKYKDFDRLAEEHPRLAGHSMWYYISQNYGKSTVSNLLYLTRINRSIESGFLYVLGTSYGRMTVTWKQYFEDRYAAEEKITTKPNGRPLKFKNKRKLPITQAKLSPDGKRIAYVTNEIGKQKIYIHDLRSKEREMVLKVGFRNAFQATDYSYPLLTWSPNNMEFLVIYEQRDVIKLLKYDLNTKDRFEDILPNQFQRINSVDFYNVSTLLFSATVRGYSDLFYYYIDNRQSRRITNDFWDDLDASVVNLNGRKGVLWASNRLDSMIYRQKLDSILPIDHFDIFYYDLKDDAKEVVRVTSTPGVSERAPIGIDTTWFAYLSNANGINNRQVGFLDTVIAYYEKVVLLKDSSEIVFHRDSSITKVDSAEILSVYIRPVKKLKAFNHPTTNYRRNLRGQHKATRSNKLVDLYFKDGVPFLYIQKVDSSFLAPKTPILTRYIQQQIKAKKAIVPFSTNKNNENSTSITQVTPPEPKPKPKPKPKEKEVDIDNYLFQSEFDDAEPAPAVSTTDDGSVKVEPESPPKTTSASALSRLAMQERNVIKFRPSRIIPYRLKFRTDFVTTQMDNGLLFGGLDSYSADNPDYNFPPPGILLKANFKDLFEDYQLEAGVRVPISFNGAEYFIFFDDRKKRLDKRYALYRRSLRFTDDDPQRAPGLVFPRFLLFPTRWQENVFIAQYQLRYPLDIFRSIRAMGTLRLDRRIQLSTELDPLNTPTVNQQRLGLRLEYVFDNTLDVALNIKNGTRYKIYGEVYKGIQLDFLDNAQANFKGGFMTVLGLDARHYQRLDKHSILAVRLAAATSFGDEQILFFLGGVDNWIFNRFNNNTPLPAGDYAYQTLAANLRGFKYNIRNGNSFALVNTELRVPMFKYFFRRIRSNFFRNFQVIGFFDAGTAWQGSSPFNDENPLNTETVSKTAGNTPISIIEVKYFRDPLVAGYGVGVRSVLFGYFVRLDYGWGIETRQTQDPRLYFSIGMDF